MQVLQLREMIRFLPDSYVHSAPLRAHVMSERENEYLTALRKAIADCEAVTFSYRKKHTGGTDDETERKVYPYGLVHLTDSWYLIAFCSLREAIRHFRLDRMRKLKRLPENFQLPADFSLSTYSPPDDRRLRIVVRFSPSIAPAVLESRFYYIDTYEERSDGLYVTLRARHEREVLSWILSWGSRAFVLEPQSLQETIREEIQAMARVYP